MDEIKDSVNVPPAPSSDGDAAASPQPGGKRKQVRTALTLREKAIVKSFCEQKVNDCKARGELVPSQEALRREVATQFGWSCGRSTLSKIMSMDWKLLRGSQDGGDAPRNPNMKRRRRPLFPAFEADLVKFIAAHLDEEGASGRVATSGENQSGSGGVAEDNSSQSSEQVTMSGARGRVLTEALILEEAQRLKQVHGVSDDMLVLSVGWLARFKHRHCIRLRKPAGMTNKAQLPLHQSLGVSEADNAESGFMSGWSAGLMIPPPSQTIGTKADSMPHPSDATAGMANNNGTDMLSTVDQQSSSLEAEHAVAPLSAPKRIALCAAQWYQGARANTPSIIAALLEQIPDNVRALACSCQGSALDDDLIGGIAGLRLVVIGFGSVVKALLAAALVGAEGFVTCVEASPASVYLAEQAAESYCLGTLGLPLVNIKFIVGEYGGMSQTSSAPAGLDGDGLKSLQGQADLALCNCSIQSLEFPASKNAMLGLAFGMLKVGGELRVTDLVCSRRLSSRECEETRFAMETSGGAQDLARASGSTRQFEQKLLLSAPYVGDLKRLYRSLSSEIEVRSVSCHSADAAAIDVAVSSLLPSLASSDVRFRRITFHAFRLQDVEYPPEDYGQTAVFQGWDFGSKSVDQDASLSYRIDDEWNFQRGVCTPVDGNTAQILQTSWIQRFFTVSGDRSRHRGPFVATVQQTGPLASGVSSSSSPSESELQRDATTSSTEPLEMVDI
ncbi:unnamed protein product [Phytophthora lilii]|uniref:Unnamed protein product n=1 Tax=Phytophthora lilii TaxID=2077276 RepID=A0A9W6UAW6_9STRA|nr:unnamed protein product [Phytophthora lilii]